MAESHVERVHTEPAVLDIGGDIGALMLYTGKELVGREIEVSRRDGVSKRVHTQIHERLFHGQTSYAGLYPSLPAGEYDVWGEGDTPVDRVTIVGGAIAELDWR